MSRNYQRHSQSGFRVLLIHPGSITADIWLGGLRQCLLHTGIETSLLPFGATSSEINSEIERVQPNIFIATDASETLRRLDLRYLLSHKRNHGCLRLFVPVSHARMPGGYSTPSEDEYRWQLKRDGLTADAHFSIFEADFYERFARDPDGPDLDFVTVPQACNPFTDYPRSATKHFDYFMATTLTNDRLQVTYKYLIPIMKKYRGLWAGQRWTFGIAHIRPEDMGDYYAQARIALSPLAGFVPKFSPELTHRVYAAAGCGAFQITMPTAVTEKYFSRVELMQAKTPREYAEMFDYYIGRPDERNVVALRSMTRAYRDHTCFNRVDQLVSEWKRWQRKGLF